ncbi:MAG: hypothetical protein SFY80_11175 [Verrucomicrobiota bacterium]|nr:hypothetical protein [Verrucomicrobiota bacterium]
MHYRVNTLLALCITLIAVTVHGQITIVESGAVGNQVNLSANYTQNFDTLPATGTTYTWTNNSTLPGWYASATSFTVSSGSATAGGLYSYGSAGIGERALGMVADGLVNYDYIGVRLVNGTNSTISDVAISYTGEQWRRAANNPQRTEPLTFTYQFFNAGTGSITAPSGWTSVPTLNFISPNAALNNINNATLDGNATGNKVTIAESISVDWASGRELWLRWMDINDPGNDHSQAIDLLTITSSAVPEPATSSLIAGAVLIALCAIRLRRKYIGE